MRLKRTTRQANTKVTAMTTGVSLARIARDQQRADAGDAEDLLGDDGAAEHGRHLQRHQRHDRDQRVAHHVLDDHLALADALGARRGDVVEPDDVEHRGAHVAHQRGALEQAEHRDRHDRLLDMLPVPAPAGGVDVGAVDEGQPVELDAEHQDQQQAGEEGRQREADEGQRVGDLVEDRIGPRRRPARRPAARPAMARICDGPITNSVVGRRCRISLSTSMRLANEKPQSPCSMATSQRR